MKHFFTRLTRVLLFIFFPGLLFAQNKNDYSILLTSGKFVPAENVNSLTKSSDIFQKSLFSDKHYVTIQFKSLPDQLTKDRMKVAGIELLDYIPNYAYTVVVSSAIDPVSFATFNIRSVILFTPAQKAHKDILTNKAPSYAVKMTGYADVDIILYEKLTAAKINNSLSGLGATIVADVPSFRMMTVRIPVENISGLASLPFVQWAEYIAPPNVPENLPGRTLHRVNILNDGVRNLKGDGMNIGVWDEIASQHLDFSPAGRLTNVAAGGAGSHGTHVSGTIGSKGIINPIARGMAPNASLFSYSFGVADIQAQMATEIPARTLISSNHSYHDGLGVQCGVAGASVSYSLRARNTDINLNNNLYHLHCHSSGNNQGACSGGWGTITGTGKAAKNNVVVGSITIDELLSSFSSCGPVHDGRVKPEIVAMGSNVFSTYTPLNTYNTISGTSMSTPGITGTVALLAQRYKQLNGNVLPPSSLIKNIACNTAQDLGNPGPDYRFGFGRINALAAVKILETNRYALGTIATGATNDVTITVPAGASRLRVMLTWNDPAAAANAAFALVNNLDLRVIEGANTYLPWILDPVNPATNATQADDNISNIEQVTVNNPAAGTYTLRVNGEAITTGPNQIYALTWDVNQPYIEVIYPNGGETFNPGASQIITWDNSGVTGTQTVEYSLDNGGSWTTISSTIPAATTRLTWSVPAGANTSTALIRVSSGTLTDQSDVNFKILGTTTGFAITSGTSCSSGEISFTWAAVTNATHYDIYRLDPATGDFVILSANITGTSHTAGGLTPGASMWFTIKAKNNTTLAESERAVAINGTVSSGGGGLGAIGGITGQATICGTPSGIPYNISAVTGATGYTWTAPPGATIASGQGTNSITINYLAGSSSGNVAVFATNGTCNTPTSTLPVNVGGAGIAAPFSGGNQSQTVCPGGVVPTLTATATVPAGHTVIWYDAASGGSVVASPTLSTAGTVTYHAASRNTASGCESNTRTPVTLTITQVATAAITAAGPVTFCQGNNVVLTATAGSSYLWSNGATTQSITVTAGGSYSVQVTTGICVSTSPATVVTVNPSPVANITAGGVTTFCQGLNVVLTASAGSSWLWSNGATTQSITVTTSGNYSVIVTNGSGCSATSAATTVTVNPNPPAVITTAGTTTFCQGGSVVLTANAGSSYLWSNGATTQSITVSTSGTFTVAVTQSGGCVSNSPGTTVTVNPIPAANITAGGATTFCQGNNVVLTASAGNSWLWSNGATTQSITVGTTGNYSVTVTNASGCFASSSATAVSVSPNPVATITAAPYSSLFPGLSTTLTANVTPPGTYNYTWFKNGVVVPGATTAILSGIDLSDVGSYTVTVTNTTGLPCNNTSPAKVIADSATTKLFIYPSPNGGQFSVVYYTPGTNAKNTLVIYDSKGAQVYNRSYAITSPYQTMPVDLRQHGRGIYRVALFDKTGKKIADGSVVIQ